MSRQVIQTEDLREILAVITSIRNRVLILLLLYTGIRIGELLQLKMTDFILAERKILLFGRDNNVYGCDAFYN